MIVPSRGMELGNREAARRVRVPTQKLDYLTSEPQQQRRARRSLVAALARLPQDRAFAPVPEAWLTGQDAALIHGSTWPPGYQLEVHWIAEELAAFMRGFTDLSVTQQNHALAALMGLTSPESWRVWLLHDAAPLSTAEAERSAGHLAEAFRIILAPLRTGNASLNPRAVKALAALGVDKVITS